VTLLLWLCLPTWAGASVVTVTVDARVPRWTISPYLLGGHFVYAYEKDSIYADGRLAEWMGRAGVRVIRYPGGAVVKYWHWEDPTGVFSGDRWNPEYDRRQDRPGSEFMDLDEYLDFCRHSGAEPMVGVNIHSGYAYDRVLDSVAEAVRCVRHCRDVRNMPVRWWYLGNEEPIPLEKYADLINRFAAAMRAVEPNIRIIVNLNKVNATSLKRLLALAGDHIDMVEFHGKWKGFKVEGSFDMWADEVPLVIGDRGYTYSEHIRTLRWAAEEAGYPNLLLANNEWGLGGKMPGFDKYHRSLVMVDYLLDLFKGNYDMACLWNSHWPNRPDMHLIDSTNGYSINPIGRAFELLATSLGETMLTVATDNRKVYGFACRNAEKTRTQIFLLNKDPDRQVLCLAFEGFAVNPDQAPESRVLCKPGELKHGEIRWEGAGRKMYAVLPPFSFARLTVSGTVVGNHRRTSARKPDVPIIYADDGSWGDSP